MGLSFNASKEIRLDKGMGEMAKKGDILAIEWRWGREGKLPDFLSKDEVRRLERAAEQMIDPRYPAMITLMSRGGLRLSEVASLKAKDVNLRDGIITIRSGKGGFERGLGRALRAA